MQWSETSTCQKKLDAIDQKLAKSGFHDLQMIRPIHTAGLDWRLQCNHPATLHYSVQFDLIVLNQAIMLLPLPSVILPLLQWDWVTLISIACF